MANNCYFQAKVTGTTKEDVEKMKTKMNDYRWSDGYDYAEIDYDAEKQTYLLYIYGDCAWSISSSMTDYGLINDTKECNVVFEAFSEESGIGFEEHLLVKRGIIKVDDCIDMCEYDTNEFETVEEFNKEYNANLSQYDFDKARAENAGYIKTGGIDDWGSFREFTKEQLED